MFKHIHSKEIIKNISINKSLFSKTLTNDLIPNSYINLLDKSSTIDLSNKFFNYENKYNNLDTQIYIQFAFSLKNNFVHYNSVFESINKKKGPHSYIYEKISVSTNIKNNSSRYDIVLHAQNNKITYADTVTNVKLLNNIFNDYYTKIKI